MAGSISPAPKHQFFTNAGVVASGYKLFTYEAGTTTKLSTYTDVNLTSANTNPIVLDSAGRATIFLSPGTAYKFVFTTPEDTDPPVASIWTVDNVNATEPTAIDVDITGTGGELADPGVVVYLSDGSGSKTAGRWYKADAANTYSSTAASAVGCVITALDDGVVGTIRIAGRLNLADWASTPAAGVVGYISAATPGTITDTPPANARPIGISDNANDGLVISPWAVGTRAYPSAWTFGSTLAVTGVATFTAAPVFTAPPIGAVEFARSTSDFTKNANTTLDDVTGLAFAVAANETWVFDFILHGICQTAADWKFAVTCPSTPTAIRYGLLSRPAIAATSGSASGDAVVAEGFGLEESLRLQGIIRNGANAGNVQLQMAQNTSNASDTIIRADSCVIAHRIA